MASGIGSRKSDFEKQLVGIVQVTTGNKTARIKMLDEKKTFANGKTVIELPLDELPPRPKLQPNDTQGKRFRIRMTRDGDEVEAFTPVNGVFKGVLFNIGPHKQDEPPAPIEKTYKDTEDTHLEFFAAYRLTGQMFKGVETPGLWMHYKFEEDRENEGFAGFAGNFENKKATRLFQLRDWIDAHQLGEDPIQWPDDGNILPELLERALDSEIEVNLLFENGYIKKAYADDGYGDADEPSERDLESAKAKLKKSKVLTLAEEDDEFEKAFPVVSHAKLRASVTKANGKKPAAKVVRKVPPVKRIKASGRRRDL